MGVSWQHLGVILECPCFHYYCTIWLWSYHLWYYFRLRWDTISPMQFHPWWSVHWYADQPLNNFLLVVYIISRWKCIKQEILSYWGHTCSRPTKTIRIINLIYNLTGSSPFHIVGIWTARSASEYELTKLRELRILMYLKKICFFFLITYMQIIKIICYVAV